MANVRKDIANLGGTWSDTMRWYAAAVGHLRTLAFDDRTSWTYLAAIHGFDPQGWIRQNIISNTVQPPPNNEMQLLFNQCQHAGWFFLPWHRGYLHAFEGIIANWIQSQGGPTDWALPYWNYLNDANSNARNIPQEFLDTTYTDPVSNTVVNNPLADARRGPATKLGPEPWIGVDISLDAQNEAIYTAEPGTLGYGGPISGFAQQGNAYGALESDPHNYVHVMVGGDTTPQPQGWMYDPNFAALDPIFWVHHCNIDRLWAAWLTNSGNEQEDSAPWQNGPFPRQFTMPTSGGSLEVFLPGDTLPGQPLQPIYDDLTAGTGIAPATRPTRRATLMSSSSSNTGRRNRSSILGSNRDSLDVENQMVKSSIELIQQPKRRVLSSTASSNRKIYLNVEGVKGEVPSGVLDVTLAKKGASPEDPNNKKIKSLVFFGLGNATSAEGPHGGNGMSATVEVTDIVNELMNVSSTDDIDVYLAQPIHSNAKLTVERISLYAQG